MGRSFRVAVDPSGAIRGRRLAQRLTNSSLNNTSSRSLRRRPMATWQGSPNWWRLAEFRSPPYRPAQPLTSTACGPRDVGGATRRACGRIVDMSKDGRGSVGGRANEGGSVYRSSVARTSSRTGSLITKFRSMPPAQVSRIGSGSSPTRRSTICLSGSRPGRAGTSRRWRGVTGVPSSAKRPLNG